jgi:hypothetical protein
VDKKPCYSNEKKKGDVAATWSPLESGQHYDYCMRIAGGKCKELESSDDITDVEQREVSND